MMNLNGIKKMANHISYIMRLNFRMRYSGTKIGKMWAFLSPALQIGMYVFVFGFVMNENVSYTQLLWLVLGYGSWLTICDGILSSANAIVMGKPILKNFQIQPECFAIAASIMGLPSFFITLIISAILIACSGIGLVVYSTWLFVLIPLMLLFIMGLGLILSTITVFIRDIYQILNVALTGLLFLSPIFYDISLSPPFLQKIAVVNPIYNICYLIRCVLVSQKNLDWFGFFNLLLATVLLWMIGLRMMKKYGPYFEAAL